MERGLSGLIIVIFLGWDCLGRPRRETFQNFKRAELNLPRNGLRVSRKNATRSSQSFRGTSGGSRCVLRTLTGRATSRAPRTTHPVCSATSAPPRSGTYSLLYPLTPNFAIARALSSTTDLRRKLLSVSRITCLVVFIWLRGPRHPCARFSGDLLEFTLEVCGAFELVSGLAAHYIAKLRPFCGL